MAVARIIANTVCDLARIVASTEAIFGFNVARELDGKRKQHSTLEFTTALQHFDGSNVPESVLLAHSTVTILLASEELDFIDATSFLPGIAILTYPTSRRGLLVVLSGSLANWQQVIEHGLSTMVEENVRAVFTALFIAFEDDGLRLWTHLERSADGQNNLYLEHR